MLKAAEAALVQARMLIAKWREQADSIDDDEYEVAVDEEYDALNDCANELEAIIGPAAPGPEES